MEDREKQLEQHVIALTNDIVRLATLTNQVLMEATIPAKYSEECSTILQLCNAVYEEFVNEQKETK